MGMLRTFRNLLLFQVFTLMLKALPAQTPGIDEVVDKRVVSWKDTLRLHFLSDKSLHDQGWDTLAQTLFWKDVINLSGDSCIINQAICRKPLERVSRALWMNQTEPEKICYKDSLSRVHCLSPDDELFVTTGKAEFYEVKKVLADISKAISVFESEKCDPWYAQTILLIESPGKKKTKSSVGANGPFQLMRSVAVRYGLHVNKYRDDRTDLEKSARVAARLINRNCIPHIVAYLNERGIAFEQTDLWFRLLVLHAYHAGAGNVRCVINSLAPQEGGVALFKKIWQTSCGSFKNESQNYSQIALAALVNFDELINRDGDTLFLVSGDRLWAKYNRKGHKPWEVYGYLEECLTAYENDFIDDMLPYDQFMIRVNRIRREFTYLANHIVNSQKEIILRKYPASEEHLSWLSSELSRRQRYEDAIRILKLSLDLFPESPAVFDSLARAYRLSGDRKTAEKYSSRSAVMTAAALKKSQE